MDAAAGWLLGHRRGIGMVNPVLASASVSVVPFQRSAWRRGQLHLPPDRHRHRHRRLGAVFASEIQSKTFAVLHTSAAGQLVVQRVELGWGSPSKPAG